MGYVMKDMGKKVYGKKKPPKKKKKKEEAVVEQRPDVGK